MRLRVVAIALAIGAAPLAAQTAPISGGYTFVALNGRAIPVEFPAGSGTRLEGGTLELTSTGRFSMRFTSRAATDSAGRSAGEDGNFVVAADTLRFTPDGKESRPPVVFRYAFVSDSLRLTDTQGNAWWYVRRIAKRPPVSPRR